MNLLLCLKRPFIWLSRFRYRCGYGVHSPFAFSLITDVIYEKMPYYAYDSLEKEQKKIVEERGCNKGTQKVNRFLFRLVNKVQPATIVEVGRPSVTSLYLQSAKPSAEYLFASGYRRSSRFSISERLSESVFAGGSLSGLCTPDHLEKCVCRAWNLLF